MRRLLILLSLILIIIFSFLYQGKDAELRVYSELSNMYINLNEGTYKISIYLNKDKSIYSNMNALKIKYLSNDSNFTLNIKSFNVTKEGSYYKYEYEIYNNNQFEGLYRDFTLNFENSYTKKDIVLGNYYFSNNTISNQSLDVYYDSFNNINKIKLGALSSYDLSLVKDINKIKPSSTSFLSSDNVNLYLLIDSSYHNKSILINYNDEYYYLINDLNLNERFLKEVK